MFPRTALSIAALGALCAAAGFSRTAAEESRPPAIETTYDVPPFPAEVARPFSFGLRSLVGDFAFLEAIQVNGVRKNSVSFADGLHDDKLLARLLTYATDLDPKFRGAYRFAGNALPRQSLDGYAGGVFAAEQILQKGVVERDEDWRLHFMLGFIDSYYLNKRDAAAKEFAAASQREGSPGYLAFLATRLASHAGDLSFAEQLAQTMLAETTEESTRAAWQARLTDIEMERRARILDAASSRFRERTGLIPISLETLVATGDIPWIPDEPHGGHFFIDSLGKIYSTATRRLDVHANAQAQSGLIPK